MLTTCRSDNGRISHSERHGATKTSPVARQVLGDENSTTVKLEASMANLWFTADTHFGHAKIIDYENRPFKNVDEMDDLLIRRWNEDIQSEDTVYHLGDFSLCNKPKTRVIFDQLHGHKHLILGNHDAQRSNGWWRDIGFETVRMAYLLDTGALFLYLVHDPMKIPEAMEFYDETDPLFLHGHVHGKKRLWQPRSRIIHVGIDAWGYWPVSLKQLTETANLEIEWS